MTALPETKYAKSGEFHIAYQVIGTGPFDLLFMHGWISHIEHMWEEPRMARFLDRLASFARLIVLDKRGTGLSDPVPLDRLPTLEERMDDLRAVMDAVGSERAALMGTSEAGALSLLFAATYPSRTTALVISAIIDAAGTGSADDGKIFVTKVDNAIDIGSKQKGIHAI